MRKLVLVALLGLALGCAAPKAEIREIAPNTYLLTREDHAGSFNFNLGRLKREAFGKAQEFAEERGKIAVPVTLKERPARLGERPALLYEFTLVGAGPAGDIAVELTRLDNLRKDGIINDAEFEALKKSLLEKAAAPAAPAPPEPAAPGGN